MSLIGMAIATVLSVLAWWELSRRESLWVLLASFMTGVFGFQTFLRAVGA